MAAGKDVGRCEGRRGGYTVQEQDMVGRGDKEDTGARVYGRELLRQLRR